METDIVNKTTNYLFTLANNRKSVNMKDERFDREIILDLVKTKQTDDNVLNDIICLYQDQEDYLQRSRLSIAELGKCTDPKKKINYNGEDPQELSEEALEALYREGICWSGTVMNKKLVITVNILLDIVQHMGGNELWLFDRLHRDISQLKLKVYATTETLPENFTPNPIWFSTNFNYSTDSDGTSFVRKNKVLEDIGCSIKNLSNYDFTQIYYSFNFTDTALGCPLELSVGSGCFNKLGQNVPLEWKDSNDTTNNNNNDGGAKFINRLMNPEHLYCKNDEKKDR